VKRAGIGKVGGGRVRSKRTEGSILIDALLTLFVAGITLVSVLGLITSISRRAVQIKTIVTEQVIEGNEYARQREVTFTSK
jgi:hypothetical protein